MKVLIFIISLFVLCFILPGHSPDGIPVPGKKADSIVTARISFTGDLMCHVPQMENARVCGDSFDFNPSFSQIAPFLLKDDLTVGNFETTCSGKEQGFSGYPAFNSPDAFIHALKSNGFDFFGMANNHAMDRGEAGLLRTLSIVTGDKLGYAGTFKSLEDRDSVRILNLKGIRVGILNYTYGTNGAYPSPGHKFMLSVIDTSLIRKDIEHSRAKGAEIVTVFFHFGEEMHAEPTSYQDSVVNFTIGAGADVIIGSHPHVIGPVKFFKTNQATLDSGFVAYSLGNFFSNQYWRYTDAGVILTIELEKNMATGRIAIRNVDYLPTWVYRGLNPARKMHIIFPAERAAGDTTITFLDKESRLKAKEAFDDTRKMVERNGKIRLMKNEK